MLADKHEDDGIRVSSDPRISRMITITSIVGFLFTAATSSAAIVPDFRAFYCAGSAIVAKQDPYRIEPLRTCERSHGPKSFLLENGGVVPAPLPGYDLAPFALASALPYGSAMFLWLLLVWISAAISIWAVRSLTGMPLAVVVAAMLFSEGYSSAFSGNIAVFACTGIALAMRFCSQRRYTLAAGSVALAMCEPHVGLGAFLAMILFIPAARIPAALCAGALGALSVVTIGVAGTLEYLQEVLPRHALSEVTHNGQYSLTNLLHLAGVPDRAAVDVGALSYLLMLPLGIIVASRIRARLHDDAFLIGIPTAFTLIGGPFIHLVQIAAAVPAALFLYVKLPERRFALGCAIMLLATPWLGAPVLLTNAPFALLGIALLAWSFTSRMTTANFAMLAAVAILCVGSVTYHAPIQPIMHIRLPPSAFSEDAWRICVRALLSQQTAFYIALKLPTWCGLLILARIAIRTAFDAPAQPSASL